MIVDIDTWSSEVEKAYRETTRMRGLFLGNHQVEFINKIGKKIAFKYVTQNMLGAFTKTLADLQLNQKPQLGFEAAKAIQKDNALILLEQMNWWNMLYPAAIRKSYAGYCDFKIIYDPTANDGTGNYGKPILKLWGANEGEYVTIDKWKPAVNFWYEVAIQGEGSIFSRSYKIRETHEIIDGNTVITNTAFSKAMGSNNCYTIPCKWSDVASAWPEGRQPEEYSVLEGVTLLPHYRMNNIDEVGDGTGDSDYHESFVSLQESLNIIISSRQFVIRCMEEPTIAADMAFVDEQGNFDIQAAKLQMVDSDGQTKFLDITNWSSHLPNSEFQWDALDKSFYKITCMSPAIDGDLSDSSGYARMLGLRKPTIAAQRNRDHFTGALLYIAQCAQTLENYYRQTDIKPVKGLSIHWTPIFPDSKQDILQTVDTSLKNGSMSLKTAVELLHSQDNWTPAQIEEEIARIMAEKDSTDITDKVNVNEDIKIEDKDIMDNMED